MGEYARRERLCDIRNLAVILDLDGGIRDDMHVFGAMHLHDVATFREMPFVVQHGLPECGQQLESIVGLEDDDVESTVAGAVVAYERDIELYLREIDDEHCKAIAFDRSVI